MPMLLSLAFAVQSVTLSKDPAVAPLTCAAAYARLPDDKPKLFQAAVVSYLITRQIADTPSEKSFFVRLQGIQSDAPQIPQDLTTEQIRLLTPQCDNRFPQARRDGPVKLPADPLERDAICLFALSTLGGAARSMGDTDPAAAKRYNDAATRFATSFDARVAASGIAAAKQEAHAAQLIIGGARLGNAYVISNACLAPPGN